MRIATIHRLQSWSRLGIIQRGSKNAREDRRKEKKGGIQAEKNGGDNRETRSSLGREMNRG